MQATVETGSLVVESKSDRNIEWCSKNTVQDEISQKPRTVSFKDDNVGIPPKYYITHMVSDDQKKDSDTDLKYKLLHNNFRQLTEIIEVTTDMDDARTGKAIKLLSLINKKYYREANNPMQELKLFVYPGLWNKVLAEFQQKRIKTDEEFFTIESGANLSTKIKRLSYCDCWVSDESQMLIKKS
jgi:hypothetical protein